MQDQTHTCIIMSAHVAVTHTLTPYSHTLQKVTRAFGLLQENRCFREQTILQVSGDVPKRHRPKEPPNPLTSFNLLTSLNQAFTPKVHVDSRFVPHKEGEPPQCDCVNKFLSPQPE